jgi:nicotinamidase-related amidase
MLRLDPPLDPRTTAVVAVDVHRGQLDPSVATLPQAPERRGPLIERAAAPSGDGRALGVPVIHVVTGYRDPAEVAADPFWNAVREDPSQARRGILRRHLSSEEIVPALTATTRRVP